MKKAVIHFAVLLVVCLAAKVYAQEAKQDFTIVNKTGVIINELHIAPTDSDEWGEDILGKDALDVDEECDIQFDSKEDVCLWDLRIADSDGNAIEWEKIDLCKAVKVTLFYKDGKAWAEIEE